MKIFFAALDNIELIDFDTEFIELMPGVRITNQEKIKARILSNLVKDTIGILETNTFWQSKTIIYFEFEESESIFKNLSNLETLDTILIWIDDFLKNSWLYKDNCVMCDTAYLFDFNKESTEACSLRLQYKLTMANSEICDIKFSKDDLISIAEIHDKLETYFFKKDSHSTKFMLEKNFSRIGRALQFVKQAREARNLAYKITNYCAALETLFTTESAEISHKLSERTAYFISNVQEKLKTFRTIKKAYSIRSKLTHGASIDQKGILEITDISNSTDCIIRLVFEKIFSDPKLMELFDSRNSRIDEYFEDQLFG